MTDERGRRWVFPCELFPTRRYPNGVVDGDTIDLMVDRGFSDFSKKRCRLSEIDAPECRTTDLEEKARGLETKKRLIELLESAKSLTVESVKWTGKYGRFIGIVYADGVNVNNWLVDEGLAVHKVY